MTHSSNLPPQANQFDLVPAKLLQFSGTNSKLAQALILGPELFQFGELSGLLLRRRILLTQCLVGTLLNSLKLLLA